MASGLDQWVGKLEGHNEIGEALTAQLQKAEDEVQQFIGGRMALKVAADKVAALGEVVSEDLKAGKLSFESELKASEYVNRMIIRAREVLLNLADGAQNKEMVSSGKVVALRESREVVMRHCTTARVRAEQIQAAQAEAEAAVRAMTVEGAEPPPEQPQDPEGVRGRRRASGERPGGSTLDERRKAALVEQIKVKTVEVTGAEPAKPETPKKPGPKPGTKYKTKSVAKE